MNGSIVRAVIGLAAAVLIFALAAPVAADWNQGQAYKWVQTPDLTEYGVDVQATPGYILADDFQCDATGFLSDIHIWGSWYHDVLPNKDPSQVTFVLSIHEDVPAVPGGAPSHPGRVLWYRTFNPGEFTVRLYQGNLREGWMVPGTYESAADTQCWQYNFTNLEGLFRQLGTSDKPVIYWLDVQATPAASQTYFGWKTSVDHWNDAASWGWGVEPYAGSWNRLLYPPGHKYVGQPVDLAFVVNGRSDTDWGDAPDPMTALMYPTLKMHNGANHIVLPGFYLGATIDKEPDGQPNGDCTGDDINATDDEDGVTFPSPLIFGQTGYADVFVTLPVGQLSARLDAWVDFNRDNDWADSLERILTGKLVTAGLNHLDFPIPSSGVAGNTAARFRLSRAGVSSYTGSAPDGEVEDYWVTLHTPPANDLGDAPDSTNSIGVAMTAYPAAGIQANYPTVFQIGSPPYGPKHLQPKAVVYLGTAVSLEDEADVGLDEDPVLNISPLADLADRDTGDDSITVPLTLPRCLPTWINYKATCVVPNTTLYTNIWFDWNRDGDWNDTMYCGSSRSVPEWAVQNKVVILPAAGVYTVNPGTFWCWHLEGQKMQPIWMRITLSGQPWSPNWGDAGAGPPQGYLYGETEDYYFTPITPTERDYGDAPAPYPTLAVNNGASHLVTPAVCLGYWVDTEPDGQPDASALGDDNNGLDDDEDGVKLLSSLIPGQLASIEVYASIAGILDAWIDFNRDGDWSDAGERIYSAQTLAPGPNTLTFTVPSTAAAGSTFARFRFSLNGVASYDGPADNGEVEDYKAQIERAKWVQPPDLSTEGVDVNASLTNEPPYILADDFLCTSTTPISDIHIWGSWRYDLLPKNAAGDPDPTQVGFTLSIHEDIPAGTGGLTYSRPGQLLRRWYFAPGAFKAWAYRSDITEGFMDPPETYIMPGDHVCWQYDFQMSSGQWFWQEGTPSKPKVYWLDVQATPLNEPNARFGWKTSYRHWNDDAVWGNGQEPFTGTWAELRYPPRHPRNGQSIDLAFMITGPPQDYGDAPDPTYPTIIEHNGASHAIVDGWYLGNLIDAEPQGQPNPSATGDDATDLDDEDGVVFVTPIIPLVEARVWVTASQAGKLDAWLDANNDGDWADAGEKIFNSVPLVAGTNSLVFTLPDVPGGYSTFARFRYSKDGGLSYGGTAPIGEVEDYMVRVEPRAEAVSKGSAKLLPRGSRVVFVKNIVTANFGQLSWFLEEPDRSAGIGIFRPDGTTAPYMPGDVVTCYGITIMQNCELVVQEILSWRETADTIAPLGQNNKSSGGGPIYQTPPPVGVVNQPGMMDIVSGDPSGIAPVAAVGCNNIGSLVRLWGRCTFVEEIPNPPFLPIQAHFWIDDGSNLRDGSEDKSIPPERIKGIKVRVPATGLSQRIVQGAYYGVTGVLRTVPGRVGPGIPMECVRYLWPRSEQDIAPYPE